MRKSGVFRNRLTSSPILFDVIDASVVELLNCLVTDLERGVLVIASIKPFESALASKERFDNLNGIFKSCAHGDGFRFGSMLVLLHILIEEAFHRRLILKIGGVIESDEAQD